jgi:hypothetical protein
MKTQAIITINHPDNLSANWVIADVIDPFIADVNTGGNDEWNLALALSLTETQLRDKALRSALLLVLSDFPEDMSNEWILDGVLNDDERIIVWEPFSIVNWDKEELVAHIEQTADTIYNTYFQ